MEINRLLTFQSFQVGDVNKSLAAAIQEVVEFSQNLPEFARLDKTDQVLLLKMGSFEVRLRHTRHRKMFIFHD